jgi:hypothetical protein
MPQDGTEDFFQRYTVKRSPETVIDVAGWLGVDGEVEGNIRSLNEGAYLSPNREGGEWCN